MDQSKHYGTPVQFHLGYLITAVSVTLESFLPLVYPVAMAVCAGEGPNLYDKFQY